MKGDECSNLERTQKCAQQVGRIYVDWYKEGPFAKELPKNKDNFLNDTDFLAGLAPCLFWELKRLGLWDSMPDEAWDDACDLAMESAWDRFHESLNQ